jgi:predicted permease
MSIWQDVVISARMLVKDRWYTAVAVLALGLGIGLNSTVFTFVNAVLLRGLPYPDSERIMALNSTNLAERQNRIPASYPDFEDWRAAQNSFEDLAASLGGTMNVSDGGRAPERLDGAWVSANAFRLLRQPVQLGRDFQDSDDDPGAPSVAIVGYNLWQNRYGGDLNIIGKAIRINEVPTVVIGVMPDGVEFPNNNQVWQPLVQAPSMLTAPAARPDLGKDRWRRNARMLNVFGRLRSGASRAQAQAEMDGIAKRLERQYPDTNKGIGARVVSFTEQVNGGPIRVVFLALMGAAGFVLLIACANVANLLLARSAQRAREMAVRVSLGATRWRLMRQLLVESVMLGFVAGAFGLLLAQAGVRLFDRAVADTGKPYWIVFTMDGTVVMFLVSICVATGVIFGFAPALQVSRSNTNELLKETGRSGGVGAKARRFSGAMVVFEVALTIVLLVGAGLMVRSFFKLYSMDLGFRTDGLLVSRLLLAEQKYPTADERRTFHDRLLSELKAIPGATSAALMSAPPLAGGGNPKLQIDGRTIDRPRAPRVTTVQADGNYFETLQLPMRRGRAFRPSDGTPGHEVAVVNERFVALYFPDQDPIGRRIRLFEDDETRPEPWLTIVGVAPTVRQRSLEDVDPDPVVFTALRQDAPRFVSILVRTSGEAGAAIAAVRRAVQNVDPDQPVFNVRTMDEHLARARWPWRVFGSMFAILAAIALVLAAVGIYAVTSYSVAQRTQEIGVRVALGAHGSQVSWLILRRGLVQLGAGVTIGLLGSYLISGVLASVIVQVEPDDPVTFTGITVLLLAVTLAACLVPARRAVRLDPVVALRSE